MRGIKDLRQFHPDRGEIVDVEEAAVIDLLRRDAPEGKAISLIIHQLIERIEAARVARRAVDLGDRSLDRLQHLRRFLAAPVEPALDDLLLPRPLGDACRIGLRAPRQIIERGDDALEFGVEILVAMRREEIERDLQDVPIGAGRDRPFVLVVVEIKRAGFEPHLQLAALEHAPVLIAEDRQQHLVVQVGLQRPPVDVEIGRVDGARAILEHVHPPRVERLADAHVVRDEVEHLAHPVRVQLGHEGVVFLARTDRGVQLVVIGDVVAVQALGARLKIGRGVAII